MNTYSLEVRRDRIRRVLAACRASQFDMAQQPHLLRECLDELGVEGLNRVAMPILTQYGVHSPPSRRTWMAVIRELESHGRDA